MVEPYETKGIEPPTLPLRTPMDVYDWSKTCPEWAEPDPRAVIYGRANALAKAVTR